MDVGHHRQSKGAESNGERCMQSCAQNRSACIHTLELNVRSESDCTDDISRNAPGLAAQPKGVTGERRE
jgi:hypothetical protein